MKTGVTQWFLDCDQGPESLERAAELGFSAIHINACMSHEKNYLGNKTVVQRYKNVAKKCSIEILGIAFNSLESTGVAVDRQGEIDCELKQAMYQVIDATAALQAPFLYFPSFHRSRMEDVDAIKKTALLLQCACDYALGKNVDIVTENTLDARNSRLLFQRVNRKKLKLLLDTQNPFISGHCIIDLMEEHFPEMVSQVHVKDGTHSTLGNARLGKGDVRLKRTLEWLMQRGFQGVFILENDYRQGAQEKVAEDLENLEILLEEMAHV